MALSDGIHPRSFSGEVTTYFTAGFSQLNEHTYKSGTFRGNVTKSPFSRRFKMIFPLFSRRVFSKLKRLGQKQDKKGLSRCQIPIQQYLNREKRAAKIAARFFNTSISQLVLDTSQLQSVTDSKTLLLAFVITTVND